MVNLTFNAADHDPWQGAENDTPHECALRLWLQYHNAEEDMSLASACELAPYDPEAYKAVREWAWSQDVAKLSQPVLAMLGRVLGRKPPPKGAGRPSEEKRNARLLAIAEVLVRIYSLPRTRGVDTSIALSASSVLAELPRTPSEKTIVNILTVHPRK